MENKIQSIMIIFVYAVIAFAFFYANGFETTGRAIKTSPDKLSFISLVISAFILVAFGLLIIYSKRKIYRKK
jgi:hypothetical protein